MYEPSRIASVMDSALRRSGPQPNWERKSFSKQWELDNGKVIQKWRPALSLEG